MTIILSYQKNNTFLLAGDLLVSGAVEQESVLDIPTRFDKRQPQTSPYFVGLTQKVFVVNPTLAVAWAGSKIVARHLIRRIATELPVPCTGPDLVNLIAESGLSRSELESVSFIFYGMQAAGEMVSLFVQDYQTGQTVLGPREKFKYAGSGGYHFFESIAFNMRPVAGVADEQDAAACAVIGRMAIALFEEFVSDATHNFFYGGGFELLGLDRGPRFIKLPMTFAFWRHSKDGLRLIGPILSLNYGDNGHLFIHRLHQVNSAWELKSYVVGHLLNETSPPPPIPDPDFDTLYAVHYIVPDEGDQRRFLLKKGLKKNLTIQYSRSANQFSVTWTNEFLDELKSTVGLPD